MFSSRMMPSIGWMRSSCMQTPTTRMRVSLGAIRIACSSMPGTPTASKITSGRIPSIARQASIAERLAGIDDDVGTELLRELAPLRREVRCDDRADAAHPQLGDACETDRPEAEHDRAVAAADAALGDGVHSHCERLGERRHVRRQSCGHLDRRHLVEHHQLGVAAVVDVREADAVQSVRVERDRHAHDHVADLQVVAPGAEVDHLAAELVTHHDVAARLERRQRHRRPAGVRR